MKSAHVLKRNIIINALGVITLLGSLAGVSTYSLFVSSIQSDTETNDGAVGILSYFHCGKGTSEEPFVITRPRHLYNLSRLHELGAFSSEKFYFQVGYDLDGDGEMKVYDSDLGSAGTGYILDMSEYTAANSKRFRSIGSHMEPFLSNFVGNNITIDNLTVSSQLDDVGVFGYVADSASVSGLYFTDLVVKCDGYDTTNMGDIFTSTLYNSSMQYAPVNGNKIDIGTTDTDCTEFSYQYVSTTASDRGADFDSYLGTYEVTLPDNISGASYEVNCSNPLITLGTTNAGVTTVSISAGLLEQQLYLETYENYMTARIYVNAYKIIDGFKYSRVVDSYQITVINFSTISSVTDDNTNITTTTYNYDVKVEAIQDYLGDSGQTDYNHGNNIGLVVGHCDGSLDNLYVYNGTISTNNSSTSLTAVDMESDYGLVGEIGDHITNSLNAEDLLKGDTGYLAIDDIYNKAVSSTSSYSSAYQGSTAGYQFIPNYYETDSDARNLYDAIYKMAYSSKQIGSTYSDYYYGWSSTKGQIAFKTGYVVLGNKTNGLGVFDILTNYNGEGKVETDASASSSSAYNPSNEETLLKNVPSCSGITNNTKLLYVASEVYDETQRTEVNSEYYFKQAGGELRGTSAEAWARTYMGSTGKSPVASSMSDKSYEFNKQHSVYLYEINLTASTSSIKRYFHDTQYSYLQKILEDTLVDAFGDPIPTSSSNFGITLRTVNSLGKEQNLTSITKYMSTIGRGRVEFVGIGDGTSTTGNRTKNRMYKVSYNPTLKKVVWGNTSDGLETYDGEYYPFGEMNFSLSRESNVTVVYPYFATTTKEYTSPYFMIQRRDIAIKNSYCGTRYGIAAVPVVNKNEINNLYYFPEGGNDNTAPVKWSTSSSGNGYPLFVHTFKLPAGDYFFSNNANAGACQGFCYLSVDGQEDGRLSGLTRYQFTDDKIENVDFLLADPTGAQFVLANSRVRMTAELKIASTSTGSVYFTVSEDGTYFVITSSTDGSVLSIMTTNNGYMEEDATLVYVSINGGTASKNVTVSWEYSA